MASKNSSSQQTHLENRKSLADLVGLTPQEISEHSRSYLRSFYQKYLQPGDTVWDVGAYRGVMSFHFLKDGYRVVSIEGAPTNHEVLRQNVGDRATIVKKAVDSRPHSLTARFNDCRPKHTVQTVDYTTLDILLEDGVPVPKLVKVDIEGMESLAMLGTSELRKHRPIWQISLHEGLGVRYKGYPGWTSVEEGGFDFSTLFMDHKIYSVPEFQPVQEMKGFKEYLVVPNELDKGMPESDHRNAVILQQASGDHEQLLRFAEPHHQAYCDRHKTEYVAAYGEAILAPVANKHPYWEKVALLNMALSEGYEYVIWLDADCLIVDPEVDLREACTGVGATYHDLMQHGFAPPAYDHFNCGAVYLRNTPETRQFVMDWWNTSDEDHPWHDQHSFNQVAAKGLHYCKVDRLEHKWNSTAPYFTSANPVVRAWHGLGSVKSRLQEMQKALGEQTEKLLMEIPVQDLFDKGQELLNIGDSDNAVVYYRAALRKSPDEPTISTILASVLAEKGENAEAAYWLRKHLGYHPEDADGWRLLAGNYCHLGEHDLSFEAARKAVNLSPRSPKARWNYAIACIKQGHWRTGWEDHKWGMVFGQRSIRTLQPEMKRQNDYDPKQTYFAWADQGLGDTLNMVRFLKQMKMRGAGRILLEVQKELLPILQDFPYADEVFSQIEDKSTPPFWNEHFSLMSVPNLAGIDSPDMVDGSPYLDYLRDRIKPEEFERDGRMIIGLCKSGNSSHPLDRCRSMKVSDIQPFAEQDWLNPVSLHQGDGIQTIEDTVARILGVDAVVTVDTMVAHLAGALGVPVFMMVSKASDYRWPKEGPRTCWYDSMTIFHQETLNEWGPVVEAVIQQLKAASEGVVA